MVEVKVHWVPPYISDGCLTEYFESLGRVLEIRQLKDERGRCLGVRAVKLQMPKDHLDQLPHVISTDDKDIRFLLTVRGREPKCLGCGANGHVRAECPRTSRPRAPTQQRRTTERPATKLTSLGSVPSHQPRPAADDVSLRPQQTPATTKENSTHPDPPSLPSSPVVEVPETQDLPPHENSLPDTQDNTLLDEFPPPSSQTSTVPDSQTSHIPCGQTRYRPTQETTLTEARHPSLPFTPTPPRRTDNKAKRQKTDCVSVWETPKRPCSAELADRMEAEDSFEPGGNKFFTPGESSESQ